MDNDRKWQTDTAVGKRIGLYKLSGELGKGNFSQVKTGFHELTKGKGILRRDIRDALWMHRVAFVATLAAI